MVHWVYVVECTDQCIYVGETPHPFKEFTQLMKGRKTPNAHVPITLLALYKVNENQSFYQYNSAVQHDDSVEKTIQEWGSWGDHFFIENNMTERLFYERRHNHAYGMGKEWYRVHGGKYTKESLDSIVEGYKQASESNTAFVGENPIAGKKEEDMVDRPLCHCGMPCEVKLSKDKSQIEYECSLKNVWDNLARLIKTDKPCTFEGVHCLVAF
jgi:predicted GIY-YIG superfamily endonuclease